MNDSTTAGQPVVPMTGAEPVKGFAEPKGGFADKMVDNIDDVAVAEKGGAYESKAELERLYKIHGPDGLDEDGHPKRTGRPAQD